MGRYEQLTPSGDQAGRGSQGVRELRFYAGLLSLFLVYVDALLIAAAVTLPLAAGWQASVISSGSMLPTIARGDVVVGQPYEGERLGVGTVITFHSRGGGAVTHRIAGLGPVDTYTTRGDANRVVDPAPVKATQVISAGRLLVPLVGHPLLWRAEQRWVELALFTAGFVLALWTSRWATNPRFDPWVGDPAAGTQASGRHRAPRDWRAITGLYPAGAHRHRRIGPPSIV